MEVSTFRAPSLQEALEQVRQSLGPDASVIHTREIRRSRFGLFPQSMIEVEASTDVPVASRFVDANRDGREPKALASGRHDVTSHNRGTRLEAGGGHPNVVDPQVAPTAHGNGAGISTGDDANMVEPRLAPTAHGNAESELLDVLSELVEIGADPLVAKELLVEAADRCGPEQCRDRWLLKASLNQSIAKRLNVSGSIDLGENKQRVVAMVGPTGVGKTTSLAKIAAGFRFDLGCNVGLITLDTFRLGAVDQLLQVAELISAPLEVVSSPEQVTPALARLKECDLVLLDTAGRSPRDVGQLQFLRTFLKAAKPDSTHLVVGANSSKSHVADAIEKFSIVDPTNLLITKLDEAVDFATWIPMLFDTKLPVSYLTTGQQVPQDIVVASPRRLARELMGSDHFSRDSVSSPSRFGASSYGTDNLGKQAKSYDLRQEN